MRATAAQHNQAASLTTDGHCWLDMAMKRVGVADLKDQLSRHLRMVERGSVLEVTDRGRPIARIVPVSTDRLPLREPTQPFADFRDRRYPPAGWPVSSTTLLLQERQEDR
jgi:prevent-host-death family protein